MSEMLRAIKTDEFKGVNDCYTLNNGVKIPCVGFGTYKAAQDESERVIKTAIEAGYRCFDTASFYGTEPYLGTAIKESKIPREELFISSKAWKTEMGYSQVKEAFERTLENLQTDYLDLYLIHWPLPEVGYKDWKQLNIDTWRGMEELYKAGKVKAIGVCNYLPHHLDNLIDNCQIIPAVDQIEVHPGYTQESVLSYCKEHEILVQAWSPIGRMRMMSEPLIVELAEKYKVSPVQICLRYEVQRGILPLPKSSAMERMKQNMDLFGFEISREDMWRITTLPPMGWSGEHPDRIRVKVVESTEPYEA